MKNASNLRGDAARRRPNVNEDAQVNRDVNHRWNKHGRRPRVDRHERGRQTVL